MTIEDEELAYAAGAGGTGGDTGDGTAGGFSGGLATRGAVPPQGLGSVKTPKRTDEKHPSKLQLSSALCQSLVTQCSITPTEADSILDQAFASVNGALKE